MKLKNLLLLILLAALWGPSFLFIKIAVAEIPPLTLVLGRVSIAAVLLTLFLWMQGKSLPRSRTVWRHLAIMGLIHNTIPFVLFGWGEQYIDSAMASIMNGTVPLFTIILAHYFVVDDRLTPAKLAGVLVGFAGLLLLITPSLTGGVQVTTWGLLAIALASAMYGVAIVYSRNHLRGLPPLVAPAGQMIMATIYLLPLSLLLDRPFSLPPLSPSVLWAMAALGVLGTAVAFVVYYRLLETAPASYVSMTTYLIPVFGVILGVMVLDEQLTWHAYAGFALILLGVMIVNGVLKLKRKPGVLLSVENPAVDN
ncbi:Permease of the drug/metabolite transporter (DMT) superfamily [hydrothermal vent metagenome]|uniref:Permease of the drug/metabolite transporter (DMT) superfamily n=1 Tax=hydrothermal vent metagenome TaxID=652676 RepID=A0A3B0UJ96_9ZZZZ